MASSQEKRAINFFVDNYNSNHTPKIENSIIILPTGTPDALLFLADNSVVGLEHTSAFRRKWLYQQKHHVSFEDLSPIKKTLDKKFMKNYKAEGIDQVWLLVQICRTLQFDLVAEDLGSLMLPRNFDRVFFQWPVPIKGDITKVGVLELPTLDFWTSRQIPKVLAS